MMTVLFAVLLQSAVPAASGPVPVSEDPVDPYTQSDANAGATPFKGDAMWRIFGKADGVHRIVDDLVARSEGDRRISDIFKGQDMVRLRRTLFEQFCYLLGGGCSYTGRTMRDAHKNLGIQQADMAALVENLQGAMRRAHIPFPTQNRFLAKLAPMQRNVVER